MPCQVPTIFRFLCFRCCFNFFNVQDTATLFLKTIILKRKLTNWVMYLKVRTTSWVKDAFFHKQFYRVFFVLVSTVNHIKIQFIKVSILNFRLRSSYRWRVFIGKSSRMGRHRYNKRDPYNLCLWIWKTRKWAAYLSIWWVVENRPKMYQRYIKKTLKFILFLTSEHESFKSKYRIV